MASWLRPEKKDDQKHLPSPQLKSRIPVRMNRLCSDDVRSSSSKDKADKTARLQKDLGSKVQSKWSSRIPIAVNGKKTKVDSKDNLPMNFKTIQGGKPLEKNSGIKLRKTQGTQESAIPSTTAKQSKVTTAKQSSYRRSQKTTPIVRRRVPRQLTPTETESKQSQAREDCITNEIEEMRRRRDEIKEDLKRLDEIGQRRELEDKKWREKMDKKKKRSSGYERKMAELDEKSRRLKAQFAEENRQAIESTNKTMQEIKQSQTREDCITNEIEEIQRRQDEIKENLKHLDEKLGETLAEISEEEPKLHKEIVEMEFGRLTRENTELEMQICIINEELETYRKRIETLQADLNESKVEVKRLQSKEEYKERELANLKSEFQRKEQKWEDANQLLEKVMVEREELWDDVDYLEESLKDSQESNETLTFEVDELTIMIQEMKREYRVEHSRWGCGHLREEVELLNGSLELNEQRTVLLEGQVDAFEAERKQLWGHVDFLEGSLRNSQESNEDLTFEVDELKIMMQELKRENTQLSRHGCRHLREEVELLNGSLELKEQRVTLLESQVDEFKEKSCSFQNAAQSMKREVEILRNENATKTTQLHELKCQTSKTISDLKDDIAKLQQEKSALSSVLSEESERDHHLYELRCEKSSMKGTLEDHITRLRRENCTLTARLSKAYEKDDQLTELGEKVQLLENQLKNVTEATTASMNSKEKEMEEDYRIIKKQDETIKNLIEEITQERCDKDRLEQQSKRIRELETQLQNMEDMKRNTNHSVDTLVLEVKQERSEKERLKKRAMQAKKVGSCREKELEERIELLENQLRAEDELTNATLMSLKNKESSLQEATATIDMLTEELEREKSEKETLRKAVEVSECNSHNDKRLTENIETLEKRLLEMSDLREKTLISLKEKEWSLQEAHVEINELTQQMANKKSHKKFFKRKAKAKTGKAHRLNLIQKGTKRYTQERGSFIAGVGKRLKNLVQRRRGVSASSLVMKKKEAHAERMLVKLREDLNERGEVIQDLRSNFKDSAKELSSMRRQLEDIQCQNAELIQCLRHKEEDLQKTQRYLKENEASLDVTNETLRLKCSLLRAMEAKL
ncbi:unnamed protein product [Pocillopora meandrina]|uniref:Uncharacterized protein n=1 Tax=Pocillopora meandrina TaxID=46732 RepID=A0AAU9VPB5_9CNID|nr:unnamed protein product [Pocillopora meandrina]